MKAVQVADDQLTQSQQEQQAEDRVQVARIMMWSEGRNLVIGNRSLDSAFVFLQTDVSGSSLTTTVGSVPPCTRVQIPFTRLDFPRVTVMSILDASGRAWWRWPSGELEASPNDHFKPRYVGGGGLLDDRHVKLSSFEECN
ncbi:hypothetical protein [Streptomyces europaeiscabiei]|uniref:hypothetical protein n=1 Tax=Streptomyces europaeiscabiei TaxID=146819 RepID=UPI0038F79BD2